MSASPEQTSDSTGAPRLDVRCFTRPREDVAAVVYQVGATRQYVAEFHEPQVGIADSRFVHAVSREQFIVQHAEIPQLHCLGRKGIHGNPAPRPGSIDYLRFDGLVGVHASWSAVSEDMLQIMRERQYVQIDVEQECARIELEHLLEGRALAAGIRQVLVTFDDPFGARSPCQHRMHRIGAAYDSFPAPEKLRE